jgi:putative isomerase
MGRLRRSARAFAALGVATGLAAAAACTRGKEAAPTPPYADVLDLAGSPDSARDASAFAFSDLGAWHMFGLPDPGDAADAGFTGPFVLVDGGVWVGRTLVGFRAWKEETDVPVAWTEAPDGGSWYVPGRLHRHLRAEGMDLALDLVFVSERSALVRASVTNTGSGPLTLATGWGGDASLAPARIVAAPTGVLVTPDGSGWVVEVRVDDALSPEVEVDTGPTYRMRTGTMTLERRGRATRFALVSAYESAAALEADRERRDALLSDAGVRMDDQGRRWDGYVASVLSRLAHEAPEAHRRVAVKALETLVANWRSPLGDLRHAGLFPSWAYPGFHGVWAWDSWKHARALALFAPGLAEDQVRVMLDWQDEAGMVPDVIYADSSENNRRDTKPPLAAWAVAGIVDVTGDTTFVREVYPALRAYHAWWYTHRDHDGDGLCEYGSTDGTRIAAAWESGMDNAVRFDSATMVANGPGAWSMDQESVDLNAYLYAEKGYLASLARMAGRPQEADAYVREAEALGRRIRDVMWDEEDGFFHDVRLGSGEPIRVAGPEGWIPLWAGVATAEQARRVATVMMDPERFLARVPLPTLAMDRPEFDPADGYWRGPVWLDQAYFGVRGLERYGLTAEAAELRARLLEGPEGLTGGAPIFENYDPRTGRGLNAPHFGWSAAHLLMLLDAGDGARP